MSKWVVWVEPTDEQGYNSDPRKLWVRRPGERPDFDTSPDQEQAFRFPTEEEAESAADQASGGVDKAGAVKLRGPGGLRTSVES
jgi:hypothetical protein